MMCSPFGHAVCASLPCISTSYPFNIWYNCGMNEDQTMFAEMLGIKRHASETVTHVMRSVDRPTVKAEDFVDELDVQKEVVEEMAREKAMLEESRDILEADKRKLEAEKQLLETDNQRLEAEKKVLEREKGTLEEEKRVLEGKLASLEDELSRVKAELDAKAAENPELAAARAENAELEVKLARMGRALMAARRAAAEASKVEIGGRRW